MVKLVISLSRAQKRLILLLLDLSFVPLAFAAAFVIHYSTMKPFAVMTLNWPLLPLLTVVALALALALGTPNIRLKQYDLAAAQRTALFAALLAVSSAALAALGDLAIPAGFHVVFGLVFLALCATSRIVLLHLLEGIYRQSAAITRVLIYGAGRTGIALAQALRRRPDIVPVAFVDDNATLRDLVVAGLPVYSGVQIDRLLALHRIDRVILAMPSLSVHQKTHLSRRLERLGLEVETLPAFAQLIGEADLVDKLTPTRPGALLARAELAGDSGRAAQSYRDRVVLVSGAGGSIGLELCRQVLACRPRRLVLLELGELALYNAEMELRVLAEDGGTEVVPVLGSVTDAKLVARVLRDEAVEVVLHAAAYKHVPLVEANPRTGLSNNVFGTLVMAQQAREAGVERFVLVSTDKAVRPAGIMGASKRLAEVLVQDLATRSDGTVFSIVRFGNVFGSSGSVIPLFQDQIARGGPVTLTDAAVTRFFMTVEEASRLVLTAGAIARGGEVFVLDMGAPVSVAALARRLIALSGYSVRDADNPEGDIEIVLTGLRPGEKLHEELMVGPGAEITGEPKIIRVREEHLTEIETAAALRDLREALDGDDRAAIAAVLARWVGAGMAGDKDVQRPVDHPQAGMPAARVGT